MPGKAQYQTRQRKALLNYLQVLGSRHFTAVQAKAYLDGQGISVGTATIYRYLDRLVQEGIVRKYMLDTGESACYEYVGESCCEGTDHFHMKCESCGALMHMDCEKLQALRIHLQEHHGFKWNTGKTVFYGLCAQCQAKET